MPSFDATSAECLVFTYKQGLLSKIAHDLKLRVGDLQADWNDGSLRVEIEPRSLAVVHAMKDGEEHPSALSDKDKQKIADSIAKSVLHPDKHRAIVFESSSLEVQDDGGFAVTGTLELHGVKRPVQAVSKLQDGRHVAEVKLHQPDFGITPFSAMMGTLKVQPDVLVRISLPA
jgi:polyisoprenoid-binding protein YceI